VLGIEEHFFQRVRQRDARKFGGVVLIAQVGQLALEV
jgi:hypothetical protein